MRLGVLHKNDLSNVVYRAAVLADMFRARGATVHCVIQDEHLSFDAQRLLSCDVVHVYRRADPAVRALANELRKRRIGLTWDNDDDVRLVEAGPTRLSKTAAQRDFNDQMKMLRRADVVTTTSDILATTYRKSGAAMVRKIENYLLPLQLAQHAPTCGKVVIGWVAALEHQTDASALNIAGALRRVMDRHPHVHVTTVGLRLGGLDPQRYAHHRSIPLLDLKNELRTFDIGIAPLADSPMSYARSNVKVKEYAAAGVPWLASARGPYAGLGPKEGGFLVEDGSWEAALNGLVESPAIRTQLHRSATAWSRTQLITGHVDKWAAVFEAAISSATQRSV